MVWRSLQLGPGAPGAGRWQPKEEDCFGHISSLNRRRPPPPGSVPGAGALLQRRGHRPSTGPGQASGLMHACVTCVGRRLHGVATSSHQPRAPVVGVAYPAGPETRAQVHRPRRRTSQSGALPGAPGRHRWRCAPWRPAWEAALRRRRHAHGSAIAAQRADLCRPVPTCAGSARRPPEGLVGSSPARRQRWARVPVAARRPRQSKGRGSAAPPPPAGRSSSRGRPHGALRVLCVGPRFEAAVPGARGGGGARDALGPDLDACFLPAPPVPAPSLGLCYPISLALLGVLALL